MEEKEGILQQEQRKDHKMRGKQGAEHSDRLQTIDYSVAEETEQWRKDSTAAEMEQVPVAVAAAAAAA